MHVTWYYKLYFSQTNVSKGQNLLTAKVNYSFEVLLPMQFNLSQK